MNCLVVGLGNIGVEYENTRHNMGFLVLDAWAKAINVSFKAVRYGSMAEISAKGCMLYLLKPSTFMNESGKAVRYWMQEKKIPLERVIVLCDDLNLPFGSIRMRAGGSDGGHNGLKNIAALVGSQAYARIRIGIGNGFARGGQIDFVLGKLSESEMEQCSDIAARVVEGVKLFAVQGADRAMNEINSKKPAVEAASEK